MATEKDIASLIQNIHDRQDRSISLAEIVFAAYQGKIIEVYVGDTYEDIKYEDSNKCYPAVVIGKVVAAFKECLVLNCAFIDQSSKKPRFGNIIFLNERSIRFITEVDSNGLLREVFLNSRDAKIIKDLMINENK
jgi:hypothetical protein